MSNGMTDVRLIVLSERRFGRLQAYESILHWASLASLLLGAALIPTPAPVWWSLVANSVSAAACAAWSRVADAERRQHDLVMGEQWEELERLVGE